MFGRVHALLEHTTVVVHVPHHGRTILAVVPIMAVRRGDQLRLHISQY
jgi:hypothetical protein